MGRIQSSVGLITGIPINDTIDQLMNISSRPRDLLIQRNDGLRVQRVAITELTALVIGVQFAVEKMGAESLFEKKQIQSANESLVTASITGTPAVGSYQITPVRQAQTHQLLSKGFASSTEPLGAGEVSFRFGGFLNRGRALDALNGGAGVERGKIRITDRSGASAQIDLRFALTIDDVLQAINTSDAINVTADVDGDRLRLTDNTGQTVANLKVQEVGLGTTAADLGLAGIDAAAQVASGNDVLRLYEGLELRALNDGTGVVFREGVADLEVTFRDNSAPLQIEFLAQTKPATTASATTEAANGVDAQVKITSVGTGQEWDGYSIVFENDDEITSGNETVKVDTVAKKITFQIDAGSTRAAHIVNALNNDSTANQLFTASLPSEGNGTGVVDVADTARTAGGAIAYADEKTLGDVLNTINAADPTRLQARISASGDRLELVDLTSGSGTFSASSLYGGRAAEDLGLAAAGTSGVISGRRRLSGLKSVLLDSLAGGYGLGQLGQLALTDRSGATATVDLAAAETVADVLRGINAAGIGIKASINASRNGIQLVDTSGGSGNLVAANADATNTADRLRIRVDASVASVNSRSLDLQTISAQQTLKSFNNGRGVGRGSFLITDSNGKTGAVNLRVSGAETVGDVIDLINGMTIDVRARINDSGDGILLEDLAGGSGTLKVRDAGSGTAAADLKLAGTAVTRDINGTPTQVIDGTTTIRVQLDADDKLPDLVQKINDTRGGVAASVFNSGSGSKPFRVSLVSQRTGNAGEMLVDASALGIDFQELVAARDALLMVGPGDAAVAGALATSSTNEFDSLIDGAKLTIKGTSTETVAVNITQTRDPISSQLNLFVEAYNKLATKLDDLTVFDDAAKEVGVLFGSVEALRVEFDLTNLITSRFFGLGSVESLEQLGISLDGEGKLKFDKDKFAQQYDSNPEAVRRFFTEKEQGLAAKFKRAGEQLAGEKNSLLLSRTQALQATMEDNAQRIAAMTTALEAERESLLKEFFRLETAIGRMQSNLNAVAQIQRIPPMVSVKK